MTVLEGAISYNVGTSASPFSLFAGLRYWNIDMTIATEVGAIVPPGGPGFPPPPAGTSQSGSADWTDFMIGGRWSPRIGEKWWALMRADVAFGSSDSYNLVGGFVWRFGRAVSMPFGYRFMNVDYSTGSGADRRALDVDLSGPFAAIEFNF